MNFIGIIRADDEGDIVTYSFNPHEEGKTEYFLGSIVNVEKKAKLSIYNPSCFRSDLDLPEYCMIHQLKDAGWKVLYCLTMHHQTFGQILQSLAGCVRSILELESKDKEEYDHSKFGIVLVLDGFDQINHDALDKLIEYGIVDPKACWDTLLKTDRETGHFVLRSFEKNKTYVGSFPYGVGEEVPKPDPYEYATKNVAHIFSK